MTLDGAHDLEHLLLAKREIAYACARINVEGIAGRSATVLDGSGPAVASDDQGFSDTFGPLDARVYVIPPAGW